MIDLGDYYSGGYFLIRADKPDWEPLQTPLLPDKLLSLSRCICPLRLAQWWGWEPGDREAARKFGIADGQMDEFVEWCSTSLEVEVEYPSVFHTLDSARRFVTHFLTNTDDLYLLGAGLHKSQAMRWSQPVYPALDGMKLHIDLLLQNGSHRGASGIERQVERKLPLEAGGTPLGYEVVGFAYSDFAHSWLCSGLDKELHDLFGVQPSHYGLIPMREGAQQLSDWIAEDKQQGHRAEPDPYAYWLLVSYPLD